MTGTQGPPRVADNHLVCDIKSSMLISGLPQTASVNSFTDQSDKTCAGIVAESSPVRIASHCWSISPKRIAVKRSTNSTLLANVTTMDSPPGISDTYPGDRTQIVSTRAKHNHKIRQSCRRLYRPDGHNSCARVQAWRITVCFAELVEEKVKASS